MKVYGAKVLTLIGAFALSVLAGGQETARLRFDDRTVSSGVGFAHRPYRSEDRLMPEILGSGVAAADFNRDGAPDLVLVNGGSLIKKARPTGAENRLYLNKGDGTFEDRTEEWDLPSPGYGMGVATGDYDNDGWTDLFLTTVSGPDTLLRNNEGRGFVNVTAAAGITQDGRWSTSAGFFDLEGDGDLDLWVVRYLDYASDQEEPCFANGVRVYCTPVRLEGLPGKLWRNRGDSTFEDASKLIADGVGKGLALALGDVDGDGDVDPYIANDTTPNHLWINDGAGGLAERGLIMGVAVSEMGAELAGMGVDLSDADGDGRFDLAVANFQGETTSLYLQKQQGQFSELSDALGIGRSARVRLSFGIEFFDIDNDGDEDLLVANGHLYDNIQQVRRSEEFSQPNTLYERIEGGRFVDVSDRAGAALAVRSVSRGLAVADFDGDGGIDYVVTNNDGAPQLAFNATPDRGSFIVLWLEGRSANRSAIGARVEARIGDRTLLRQVVGASSYLSASDSKVHLGLGGAARIDSLEVHWPGSASQSLGPLEANTYYQLIEGGEPQVYRPGKASVGPSGVDPNQEVVPLALPDDQVAAVQ